MAFTSIVIIVGVPYVFYYVGMFIYDLFIKKDPAEFMPKPKDVEIDISDEAGQFKPIAVCRWRVQWKRQRRAISTTTSTLSYSIRVRRC